MNHDDKWNERHPQEGQEQEHHSGHHHHHHSRHHKSRRKDTKRQVLKVVLILLLVILLLVSVVLIGFFVLRATGKSRLMGKNVGQAPTLETTGVSGETQEILEENSVKYEGKVYHYNQDIVTILFMGIDTSEIAKTEHVGEAGQADTIFLAALDTKNNQMSLISVSRDTMTDIEVYDYFGNLIGTSTGQLALAYAYGDGLEKSCELTKNAVSKLFYGLPINAYCSLNLNALIAMNDQVGGVTVTLLDDFTSFDPAMKKGETMKLSGKQARRYVQGRMGTGDGTNSSRMARQKQYLTAFIQAAKAAMKQDLTLPVTIYRSIQEFMVTDLSLDEATYLASLSLNMSFGDDSIHNVAGTQGEGALYSEYYVDDKALYQLILDVFYECEE